jgi:sulfatase modifying factor 1
MSGSPREDAPLRPSAGGDLGALWAALRAQRIAIGVPEVLRLEYVLSLGPVVDQGGMGQLVACLLARSLEQRAACKRAVAQWFATQMPLLSQAIEPLQPAAPEPTPARGKRPPPAPSKSPPIAEPEPTRAPPKASSDRKPEPGTMLDRETALDLPLPPVVLSRPVLLDARDQEEVVEGMGTFVTEHWTRRLDTSVTTRRTARAGGLPRLVFRCARELRAVWLWLDETARGGLAHRAAFEIQALLRTAGIPVEVALFRVIPSPATLFRAGFSEGGALVGPHPRVPPAELAEQRDSAVVAVLTDAAQLSVIANGMRAPEVRRAMRSLAGFGKLALIDFAAGPTALEQLASEHGLTTVPPEGLVAFLSGNRQAPAGQSVPLEGAVRSWAAACALAPRAADEATALALREHLQLDVPTWAVRGLLALSVVPGMIAFSPVQRAAWIAWLWAAEVDGWGPSSSLRRALAFWSKHFAERPIERALLALWEAPGCERDPVEDAADMLLAWSKTSLGPRIRAAMAAHAPRPERGVRGVDTAGKIMLPWRWSQLSHRAQQIMEELGLGRIPEPEPPPDPRISLPMAMVELPGGTFWMGSRDDDPEAYLNEKPRRRVAVGPFAIGRYLVTQEQYTAVMRKNPGDPKGADLPINKVSWLDAVDFCNRLSKREGRTPAYAIRSDNVAWKQDADGYRLPTEAEWEYAARGGTETAWSFGDNERPLGEHAWYWGNAGGRIQSVGEKKPNPFGMFDVHGNVYEWCWDWYGVYTTNPVMDVTNPGAIVNPLGPSAGVDRVLRGGSWNFDPRDLRSAYRFRDWPSDRSRLIGFRYVRGLPRQHDR